MARPRSGDKRGDLIEAAIAEVVERGLDNASTGGIAARAGVAVGTIYRYFDDKDALLRDAHFEIKCAVHRRLVEAAGRHPEPRESMRDAWVTLVELASERPRDFLFVSAVAAHALADEARRDAYERMETELRELLVRAVTGGATSDVSAQALVTLFVAPAMQLARDAAFAVRPPDPRVTDELFDMIWRGLRQGN